MKKIILYIIVVLTSLFIIITIILGISCDKYKFFYDFFNNQTIATLIGLISIFSGYQIWKVKQKAELISKYFEKLIEITLSIFMIDDSLVFEFEGKKDSLSDNIFRQKMELRGKQDSFMMLLEKYNDLRPEKFRGILNNYDRLYIDLLARCRTRGLNEVREEYSKLRKSVRFEVLKLVKET